MDNGNKLPIRKRNRLKDYDYGSSGAYFITVCTKDRKNIFWDKERSDFVGEDIILPPQNIQLSPRGKIAEEAINAIPEYYPHIKLLQYVVMPNHIHMILFIPYDSGRMISSPTSISTAIGQMKRCVSKKVGSAIWQRSFHDHVIRDKNDYERISKYIYDNTRQTEICRASYLFTAGRWQIRNFLYHPAPDRT